MNTNVVNKCVHDVLMPCSKDSDFYNQTGGTTETDYTTDPAGVNPSFLRYLASNGVLNPNGDPLSTVDVKAVAGGDFGNFWKKVFPLGSNDCDLSQAIVNINDKIAQFNGMINGNANKWVQANIAKGGGCEGCQGDAAAYIMNSVNTLKTILRQYQSKYDQNIAKGGGCGKGGILMIHYLADQNTKRQIQIQLDAQKLAQQQENELAKCQQKVAAEGAGVATRVFAASSPISPVTIGLVVGGAVFIGIIVVILKSRKKAVS